MDDFSLFPCTAFISFPSAHFREIFRCVEEKEKEVGNAAIGTAGKAKAMIRPPKEMTALELE